MISVKSTYKTKISKNQWTVSTYDYAVRTWRVSEPMSYVAAVERCRPTCSMCCTNDKQANVRMWAGGCNDLVCKRCDRALRVGQ